MARPREFDETGVLDAAMHRFWSDGFERTSVRELAQSMGITGASLYNAFGDKLSLYRRALGHYFERSVRDRIRRLDALPPAEALAGFFAEVIERSVADPACRGCMLVNAALEMAPVDDEARAAVGAELALIEAFFARCIAAGQRDGTITARQPPAAAAAMLLSVLLGMRVLARTGPDRAVLAHAADAALGLLRNTA